MSGTPEERKDAIGQPYTRDLTSVLHKFDHCACVVCKDGDHARHTTCIVCDACCCVEHMYPFPDEWEECVLCVRPVYECDCKLQPHIWCAECQVAWCIECGVERACNAPGCLGTLERRPGPSCPNCSDGRCGECGTVVCWGCSNDCTICGVRVCLRCFPMQACDPCMHEYPEHALSVCYQCLKMSPIEPPVRFWHEIEGWCAVHARMADTSLETYDPNMEHSDGNDEEGGDEEE